MMQIQLAAACNKNEQQQIGKVSGEMESGWTGKTWKRMARLVVNCRADGRGRHGTGCQG